MARNENRFNWFCKSAKINGAFKILWIFSIGFWRSWHAFQFSNRYFLSFQAIMKFRGNKLSVKLARGYYYVMKFGMQWKFTNRISNWIFKFLFYVECRLVVQLFHIFFARLISLDFNLNWHWNNSFKSRAQRLLYIELYR